MVKKFFFLVCFKLLFQMNEQLLPQQVYNRKCNINISDKITNKPMEDKY